MDYSKKQNNIPCIEGYDDFVPNSNLKMSYVIEKGSTASAGIRILMIEKEFLDIAMWLDKNPAYAKNLLKRIPDENFSKQPMCRYVPNKFAEFYYQDFNSDDLHIVKSALVTLASDVEKYLLKRIIRKA